jgi:hypothetical protein
MELLQAEKINVIQLIQLMLAPAVMISACGLLLLSINNKYSLVVNRIRLLNDEKRKLLINVGEKPLTTDDNVRLESIAKQIGFLVERGRLVRNAVISCIVAIALFVLTSLLIGILSFLSMPGLNYFIITSFLLGMIFVFIGTIFTGFEAKKGYEIILFEVKAHE